MSAAVGGGAASGGATPEAVIARCAAVLRDLDSPALLVVGACEGLPAVVADETHQPAILKAGIIRLLIDAWRLHKRNETVAAVIIRVFKAMQWQPALIEAASAARGQSACVDVLKAQWKSATVAPAVCRVLTSWTLGGAAAPAILEPGGVAALVLALREHNGNAMASVPICQVAVWLREVDGGVAALHAAKALRPLIDVVRLHPDDATLASYALQVTQELVLDDADRATIIDAGGVPAVVAAIQMHGHEASAVCGACSTLMKLVSDDAGLLDSKDAVAVVRPVLDAVKRGLADAELVRIGSSLLACIIDGHEARAAMVAAGTTAVAIAVLKEHVGVVEVIAPAVTLLAAMVAETHEQKHVAAASGAIPLLLRLLKLHAKLDSIVRVLALTLGQLADKRGDDVAAAGGIPVMVATLRNWSTDPAIVRYLCNAFQSITCFKAEQCEAVVDAGGVKAIVAAWKANAASAVTVKAASFALGELACINHLRAAVYGEGVIPLVAAALRVHRKELFVVTGMCTLITYASGYRETSPRAHEFLPALHAAGIGPLMVGLMKEYAASQHVMAGLAEPMSHLLVYPPIAAAVAASGGVPALLAMFKANADSPMIAPSCSRAISLLAAVGHSEQAAMIKAGGHDVLAASLGKKPKSGSSAFQEAARALAHLAAYSDNRRAVASERVLKPLCVALGVCADADGLELVSMALGVLCSNASYTKLPSDACGTARNPAIALQLNAPVCKQIARGCAESGGLTLLFTSARQVAATGVSRCCCSSMRLVNMLAASADAVFVMSAVKDWASVLIELATKPRCGCPGGKLHVVGAIYHAVKQPTLLPRLLSDGLTKRLLPAVQPATTKTQDEHLRAVLSLVVRLTSSRDGVEAVKAGRFISALVQLLPTTSAALPAPLSGATGGAAHAMTAVCKALANLLHMPDHTGGSLTDILRAQEVAAELLSLGAAARMVRLLHPSNSATLLHAACALLRAYAMGGGCERAIVAAGGAPALVAAMRAHASNAEIAEQACGALWNIVGVEDAAVHAAAAGAGAVPALQTVVAAHGASSPAGRMALGALAILT